MFEFTVGTRFYYKGKLCEVVEVEYEYDRCSECDIFTYDCSMMNCESRTREDGKNICFKLVEDTEENNEQ